MFELIDEWGPEKVVCVSDSRTGMRGVLVIDNTARGVGKGGTRMALDVTVAEVARIARNMTWKWAAVDLFHGGAKAGIVADPGGADKEAVIRAFVRCLRNEVPEEYVFGLDMGMTAEDAAIIVDETGSRGSVIGTPAALGGMPVNPLGVTGFGVIESADAAIDFVGCRLSGMRAVVQGFGAVGGAAARRLAALGATVVAISTARGGIHAPDGLDVDELLQLKDEFGDSLVDHYPSAKSLQLGEELVVETDLLVPAAGQDVINAELAARIPATVIVEGANLPTTPEAQLVFAERGTVLVPDFIANAGGIVAGAVAMDLRHSAIRPDMAPVFERVSRTLRASTIDTLSGASRDGGTTHQAARALAASRVAEAMRLRGREVIGVR